MVSEATPPKAVAIFGPRRIGKTTLLEQITQGQQTSWYVGEYPGTIEALSFRTQGDVVNALTAAPYLVIDEAHKIPDIGTIVKILVDTNERLANPCRIFLTSSSAIHLQAVKETAVGRVASRQMWPFSLYEMAGKFGWGMVNSFVERFLIYGLMPVSALKPQEARDFLEDYCSGHLLKDFYDLYPEKNPRLVSKIWYVWLITWGRKFPMKAWLRKSESVGTLWKTTFSSLRSAPLSASALPTQEILPMS